MPVTKHNFLVTDPGEVAETIREAFHIARTGRPGPVLVDLPKDVLVNETTWSWPDQVDLPGYKPTTKGNMRQVVEAAKLILEAKRPVLYVGGGVHQGGGHRGAVRARDGRSPPGRHHADGARRVPGRARALPGHAGHARRLHGGHRDAEGRPARRGRRALRRPRHRQALDVRAGREDRPHRHRSRGDRQEPQGRRPDRGGLQGRDHEARRGAHAPPGRGRHPRPQPLARRSSRRGRPSSRSATTSRPTDR